MDCNIGVHEEDLDDDGEYELESENDREYLANDEEYTDNDEEHEKNSAEDMSDAEEISEENHSHYFDFDRVESGTEFGDDEEEAVPPNKEEEEASPTHVKVESDTLDDDENKTLAIEEDGKTENTMNESNGSTGVTGVDSSVKEDDNEEYKKTGTKVQFMLESLDHEGLKSPGVGRIDVVHPRYNLHQNHN